LIKKLAKNLVKSNAWHYAAPTTHYDLTVARLWLTTWSIVQLFYKWNIRN